MPQINLLKQTHNTIDWGDKVPGFILKLAVLFLLVAIGYYVWLFITLNGVNKQIASAQVEIVNKQREIANLKRQQELATRQGQLKELNTLISNHIYWSAFLSELARVTLRLRRIPVWMSNLTAM